jgi:hypothetical protein
VFELTTTRPNIGKRRAADESAQPGQIHTPIMNNGCYVVDPAASTNFSIRRELWVEPERPSADAPRKAG